MTTRRGLTLVEILVVLAILAILAGLIGVILSRIPDRIAAENTAARVRAATSALSNYRGVFGTFPPATPSATQALWTHLGQPQSVPAPGNQTILHEPFLRGADAWRDPAQPDVLVDGWDRPLRYEPSGVTPGHPTVPDFPVVWSYGADGVDATLDDIGNWRP